jgi:hypothetical protein
MKLSLIFSSVLFIGLLSCVSSSSDDPFEIPVMPELPITDFSDEYYSIDQDAEGLECGDIFLTRNGAKIHQTVTFGQQIRMNFTDISGLECPDDQCELDMMFLFTTMDGDTLDYYPFGSIPPIIDTNEVRSHPEMSTYCYIISPTFSGDSYMFKSGLKDRNSGNSVFGTTKLVVKENKNVHIDSKGLEAKDAFIYDGFENTYITDNKVDKGKDYEFAISGIDGFVLNGTYANIGVRLNIYDTDKTDAFASEDLVTSNKGRVNYSEISELLSIDFQIHEEYEFSTVHVEIEVWDKNSDAKLSYWSDFSVNE